MDAGTRWAAGNAKLTGSLAWGVGLLLHVQLMSMLTWLLEAVCRGWGLGMFFMHWQDLLVSVLVLVSGPVAVAVGGGLRFLGGMLSGQKVAGERVGRIVLFEWLRYELVALGIAMIIGGFSALLGFSPTNSNWDIGLILCLVALCITVGFFALARGFRFGRMSDELMWQVRVEGLHHGMVPYPADAVPSTRRFGGGTWKEKSGSEPPGT